MTNVRNQVSAAKTWAAGHVVAAFAIGVALGGVIGALLF